MTLENISLAEAFYYNIVTMSTVGYGDIHPTTPQGRWFAIFIIVMGGATFLGVVANATELLIARRESMTRRRKLNMVLGTFFSEIGYGLLMAFSGIDRNIKSIAPALIMTMNWQGKDFMSAKKALALHHFDLDIHAKVLNETHTFLMGKRQFLIDLIENPVLIEHEMFSELLLALFHLMDELNSREDFNRLPKTDLAHISKDFNRAYRTLILQWMDYQQHLKFNYPYLFSLAVRQNPFNPDSSPVVR
ncbi:MAG: two pore domain potassium channel family protein [Desulfobacter sp.]|nr:two pore domain potassium channel family protein [Desulfobacter sp.]